jgi:hypothetical protein
VSSPDPSPIVLALLGVEHLNSSRYALHEEDIVEVSLPLRQVVAALRAHYVKVRVIDPDQHEIREAVLLCNS